MERVQPNIDRLLLSGLGLVVTVATFLGEHALLAVERVATESKVATETYRNETYREIDPIKDQVSKNVARIESLEKNRDYITGLAEERGKRLGAVEGDVKVAETQIVNLGERVAHLEGKEDRKGVTK